MNLSDGVILFLRNMLEVTDWDKKNGNFVFSRALERKR